MTSSRGNLSFDVRLNMAKLNADIKKAEARMKGMGSNFNKSTSGLGKGMLGMINPVTAGLGTVGVLMGKLAKDSLEFSKEFNAGMLEVSTISESVSNNFEGMSDKILALSLQPINDDAIGLSKAMYQIVSAGYDGAEGLKILETAAKGATAGVTDTMTVADTLTTIINAYGMEASRAGEISDKLFSTVKDGKTTMGEIGASFSQVASVAAAYGISVDDILASTAAMTKQGATTSEAITRIKAAIVALSKEFGPGVFEGRNFAEALEFAREEADKSGKTYEEFFGRVEASVAVLSLTGEKMALFDEALENNQNSLGATAKAADKMANSAKVMGKQFNNTLNVYLKDTGHQLEDIYKGLLKIGTASLTTTASVKYDDETDIKGFSDRLKFLRNSGAGLGEAFGGAVMFSNKKIQEQVEKGVEAGAEVRNKIAEDMERFKREIEAKTDGKDDVMPIIQGEITKYTTMISEWQKEIDSLEGSKVLKDMKVRINLQKDIPTFNRYLEHLNSMIREAEDKGKTEVVLIPRKSISELEDELAALQEKIGSFQSEEEELANLNAIKVKVQEIDDRYAAIREAQKGSAENVAKIESQHKKLGTTQKDVSKAELKAVRKISDEEAARLKAIKKRIDKELEFQDLMNDSSKVLGDVAEIFDALSYSTGQFNEELGEALGNISAIASEAANFTQQLAMGSATGDWVGAITSGLGLVGTLISTIDESNQTTLESQSEINQKALELNEILRERIQLLVEAGLIEPLQGTEKELANLVKQLDIAKDQLDNFYSFYIQNNKRTAFSIKEMMDTVYGKNWGVADLDEAIGDLNAFEKKFVELSGVIKYFYYDLADLWTIPDEAGFQNAINDIIEIQAEIQNLKDEAQSIVLGFTGDELTNGIVDGLMNGFELAQDGLGDFAQGFEDLLRQAGITALTQTFQSKYMSGLMDDFVTAVQSGSLDDPEVMDNLKEQYAAAIKGMEEYAGYWNDLTGGLESSGVSDVNSMTGAIKSITEAQADVLEGRISGIHVNVIEIRESMNVQLAVIQKIEHNTSYNYHLEGMAEDMEQLNQKVGKMSEVLTSMGGDSVNSGTNVFGT